MHSCSGPPSGSGPSPEQGPSLSHTPTIHSVLRHRAEATPDAPAIAAPGRAPLSYSTLWAQIATGTQSLKQCGIGRGSRVAIAVPQGPDLVVAILAVGTAAAAAAPFSPATSRGDFEASFDIVSPKALIVPMGSDGPAESVARARGIPVIHLIPSPNQPAGVFTLQGAGHHTPASDAFPGSRDVALLLSTSGTSGRPKFVPLTHRNVRAAADNTAAALALGPHDRCLVAASLYHAHGLVAGTMASLMAGGTAFCPPAFDAEDFFGWMAEFAPTWYTAVPTVHRAILQEAPRHAGVIAAQRLRFVRSGSAYLSDQTRRELEDLFQTVVTEGYGLTEAMQLTNTPLDRNARKIGSLGLAGTSRVAIMDVCGRLLNAGESGEIVARGPAVMSGYLKLPDETALLFCDGWFKTGDIGYLDADGHLYMTGRLKDQINCGGEKISPEEIDSVLLQHEAIAEAVAFGMPHATLGEQVSAAVVLRPGYHVTSDDIRRHAAAVLPAFKVPRTVFVVPAIPTSAAGKLLRRAIVASLQLAKERPPYTAPRNRLEQRLAGMWEELLRHSPVGIDDDFFDLGGDSLTAVRLFARMSDEFGGEIAQAPSESGAGSPLRPSVLWRASTVRKLARHITRTARVDPLARPLIEVQRGNASTVPLIMLTGDWGGLGFYVRKLASHLDPQRPVYAMMPHDVTAEGAPQTIQEMAAAFLPTVRAAQPRGPYLIGGYSHGGLVALELAKQLQQSGEDVALVFAIDTSMPDPRLQYLSWVTTLYSRVLRLTSEDRVNTFLTWRYRVMHARELWTGGFRAFTSYYGRRFRRPRQPDPSDEPQAPREDGMARGYLRAVAQYVPTAYSGRVTVFSSLDGASSHTGDPTLGWSSMCSDLHVVRVPGDHATCVTDHVDDIASQLRSCVERALHDSQTRRSRLALGDVLLPVPLSGAR